MTSPSDIIEIPGHPGMYARRVIVEAWQAAGSPPINDAGRLYGKQKTAWDKYQAGTGSPADDPDRPNLFPLAHVRFVALDITPTPERVRRLTAAGLVRPFAYEPWHWTVKNVYHYALVKALPGTAPAAINVPTITPEENPDMPVFIESANIIQWPNGYINTYDPNVFRVLQWVAKGQTTEPWAVSIYTSETWRANTFMANWNEQNNGAPEPVTLTDDASADLVTRIREAVPA